jgi:hypothetical protein
MPIRVFLGNIRTALSLVMVLTISVFAVIQVLDIAMQVGQVSGLTLMPGGLNATPLYHYRWNAFQGFDDAFLTKGLHSLKFGVAFERDQDNQLTAGGLPGNWTFSSL